jgi:50S ribosomal protein L16 3-hydroxylase
MWEFNQFDTDQFLKEFWQKKPCLLRNVLNITDPIISPEELAGLACENEVHSRLVIEKDEKSPWQVKYGPFKDDDFLSLPQDHYSLLVSECEKWIPEFDDLLALFQFIPAWRIDDLMVSYAANHGSVGPHLDEYDVFLIQSMGKRRWMYGNSRLESPQLIEGLELAILESCQFDNDEILNPGDMLYLPPGVAHHGVAVDPCMTWSVGFRAPDASDLLESINLELDHRNIKAQRYNDPNLQTDRSTHEITLTEMEGFKQLIQERLKLDDSILYDAIGKMLSDVNLEQINDQTDSTNQTSLNASGWVRHVDTRWLYFKDKTSLRFYCNGQSWALDYSQYRHEQMDKLCSTGMLDQDVIESWLNDSELKILLSGLISINAISPDA